MSNNQRFPGGYGASHYFVARLKRDMDPKKSRLSPEMQQKAATLLEEIVQGKKKPYTAALEMRYRKKAKGITKLFSGWREASNEEKEEFLSHPSVRKWIEDSGLYEANFEWDDELEVVAGEDGIRRLG